MSDQYGEWTSKGSTLSDTTAQKEFGLTYDEIVRGIRSGALQFREGSMHGNPWFRLLRREVEALVANKHGADYLKQQQVKTELESINRELKRLKKEIVQLEARRSKLLAT